MFNLPMLVSLGAGFAYPAYKTIDAIESNNAELQAQNLKYWVVFSLLFFVHVLLEFALQYVPLYYWLHALLVAVIATQPLVTEHIFHEVKRYLPQVMV